MLQTKTNVLNRNEILKLYTKGFTKPEDYKIGLEYERLPINSVSHKAVDYWGREGIANCLEQFAKLHDWDYITDNKNIIGIVKGHDTITLEPGAQIEISTKPERTVFDLKKKIESINSGLSEILQKHDIVLLNYGISPFSTCKNINLIPKRRYKLMANYLWGILADVMMRETAGIQCCIDFKSEEDAMRKFKLANKLSCFMTAIFSNSPIRGSVDTGYKSFRALSWLNTDNDRCGFIGKISEDFSFNDYIDCIMKTPMIFIQRNGQPININGDITFDEYMKQGYGDIIPSVEDYELQANLCFPEVRLRNFIEIRNHDCVGGDLKYAIPAIYKGIFYDNCALDETEELLKSLQYKDYSELRYNIPKQGLKAEIKNVLVLEYAKSIVNIAEKSLKRNQTGENLFLAPVKELLNKGMSPADEIIKKWNGAWKKDIRKMIKYLTQNG